MWFYAREKKKTLLHLSWSLLASNLANCVSLRGKEVTDVESTSACGSLLYINMYAYNDLLNSVSRQLTRSVNGLSALV